MIKNLFSIYYYFFSIYYYMSNDNQLTENIQQLNTSIEESIVTKNNDVSLIISLISKIDEVEKLLDKNIYSVSKEQLVKLLKIISLLSVETKNVIPLNNIINSISEIFKDGKLELYEIPLLIKVLNENILKQNISNISSADISLLIKLLIIILIELNILKLSSSDVKIINVLIDTSLELLNIQIVLPTKEQLNKCFLWKC